MANKQARREGREANGVAYVPPPQRELLQSTPAFAGLPIDVRPLRCRLRCEWRPWHMCTVACRCWSMWSWHAAQADKGSCVVDP